MDLLESSNHQKPFAMEIGFTTDDVEALYQKAIAAGAVPEAETKVKPHGQTVAYVRDSRWIPGRNLYANGVKGDLDICSVMWIFLPQ
jgi:hypothetical protein